MSTESELHDWRGGQTNAERLCAGILAVSSYVDIDPQAPLGGPDGKKDILVRRSGRQFVAAVFFPATHQTFANVRKKFIEDRIGVDRHSADGFVFMVNQPLTLSERQELRNIGGSLDEIYHLERLRSVLDSPQGYGLRLEFLRRSMSVEEQIAFFSTLKQDIVHEIVAESISREINANTERQGVVPAEGDEGNAAIQSSRGDTDIVGDIDAPCRTLIYRR